MSNKKKATGVPRFVYHAAPECVMHKIAAEGLRSPWGEIYAAGEPEHALQFMWMRLLSHMHDAKPMMIDGQEVMVPEIVEHKSIAVYTIDTRKTDVSKWEHGVDHSPAFFPGMTSWRYAAGSIPVKAIVAVDQYVPAGEDEK